MTVAQVGAFGDPGRDPRGWTVTVCYAALVPAAARSGIRAAVGSRRGWLEAGISGPGACKGWRHTPALWAYVAMFIVSALMVLRLGSYPQLPPVATTRSP